MSKQKLQTYAVDDQEVIKQLMPFLIEVQMASGAIEESDSAIKAALPAAFEDVCAVVDKLNADLANYSHVDASTVRRIKGLTLKLLASAVEKAQGRIDRAALFTWLASAFSDARQVSTAVDEYLCG